MSDLATISFQPEAHDSAATAFHAIKGYTVTVVPVKGEPWDAELVDVVVGTDGQHKAILAPWDEAAGKSDRLKNRWLDLYDDIERLEVI